MEAVLSECQLQLCQKQRQIEEQQQKALQQLARAHDSVVSKLELENARLRTLLDNAGVLAEMSNAASQNSRQIMSTERAPEEVGTESGSAPAVAVNILGAVDQSKQRRLLADEVTSKGEGSFPGWNCIMESQAVQLQVIAEDQELLLVVHEAVLERSPYFQVRLGRRWSGQDVLADPMPLRLPPGCPAAAAKVVFKHLYLDENEGSHAGDATIAASLASSLNLGDAAVAIGASQLAEMLLLDGLASQLVRIARDLVVSPEEAAELQQRFVALPGIIAEAFRSSQRVPAGLLGVEDLARMLVGSAKATTPRLHAEAVLAAAFEAGRSMACKEAVILALESMPFRSSSSQDANVLRLNRETFVWLWSLAQEYVLLSQTGPMDGDANGIEQTKDRPSDEKTKPKKNACAADTTRNSSQALLCFFTGLVHGPEHEPGKRSPALTEFFEESVVPLREAFGTYLQHLAATRQCTELQQAFKLGTIVPQAHSRRSTPLHLLRFGDWSAKLLPQLLTSVPARRILVSSLLELSPESLAELVDDKLLEALGSDAVQVCNLLAKDSSVLAQWVTRSRLLALPLPAQRRLCSCLAPSLGSLALDISPVVVQVLAGGSKGSAAKSACKRCHGTSCNSGCLIRRKTQSMSVPHVILVLCVLAILWAAQCMFRQKASPTAT
eukprot:TRINITY_DN6752_c0_g4_i1.p1 TRINITY_DN6752_c0_g4~~TRINITY_DN6752_c0_g4_i1.p1  ORF type:complete len:667 (+),score=132.98 TRINITY_DN6752_c0_g4_i1:115-2115(+)